MGGCFTSLLVLAGAVFVILSLVRWFEQTADAVERRAWNKVTLLVLFPFGAWFYPSRVGAGRPTAVPHHEPVRGFGSVPKAKPETAAPVTATKPGAANDVLAASDPTGAQAAAPRDEGPPAGTPKEFIGMPVVPKQAAPKAGSVDADKIARLREKMRQQGMLPDEQRSPPPDGDGDA